MVKGVNRTVIEVKDTGSAVFEKIVLYVSPEYGNLNPRALSRAANQISIGLGAYPKKATLRRRKIIKRRIFIAGVACAVALTVIGCVCFLL